MKTDTLTAPPQLHRLHKVRADERTVEQAEEDRQTHNSMETLRRRRGSASASRASPATLASPNARAAGELT
jgi:hypothetical protein